MTILFDATRSVKPTTSARRFGLGLLASKPAYRTDYTLSDAEWNAQMNAAIAARDAHLDQMGLEAEAVERLVSGCCL